MGVYVYLSIPTLMKPRLTLLAARLKDLISSLYQHKFLSTTEVDIELWKGFPQEALGGKKLRVFRGFNALEQLLDNWNVNNPFFHFKPYQRANQLKDSLSFHIDLTLELQAPKRIHKVHGFLSAPCELIQLYGHYYLETFHYKDHRFDQYFIGERDFQRDNRGRLLKIFTDVRKRSDVKRINAGKDLGCNENIARAFYVYRKNDVEFFKDFIRIAQDSLQSYKEEGQWFPEDYFTPEEAEVIANDLTPYNKNFLYRIYTESRFYQAELPEFFQQEQVITVPGSITFFRVNFLPLKPVLLQTLRKLSLAVKKSLQSKKKVEEEFKKALEEQRFID